MSLHIIQFQYIDLEDCSHDSRDDGGDLVLEVVSTIEEHLRGGHSIENRQSDQACPANVSL